MSLITPELLSRILKDYALPPAGIHGVSHWARVLENARRLAQVNGADPDIIELFAIFHDSRRVNDQRDDGHGRRGAELARAMRGIYFDLDDERFALLEYACREHTSGLTQAEATVQVCWDADRLDLLRVGIRPRPEFLCTDLARRDETIAWANRRAETFHVPALLRDEWGFKLE